jgi:hypothetical protein
MERMNSKSHIVPEKISAIKVIQNFIVKNVAAII